MKQSVFGVPGAGSSYVASGEQLSCNLSPVQHANWCVLLAFAMQFVCNQLSVLPLLYADEQLAGVLFKKSRSCLLRFCLTDR